MGEPEKSDVGLVLGGRFRIDRVIGEGGMGDVYQATHTEMGRQFAVKLLKQEMAADPKLVERFRREALAASRLSHPNIVTVVDFGRSEDGRFFLVMEHVEGPTLAQAMQQATPDLLRLRRVYSIWSQIAAALEIAHRNGVIHRDLKPDNVILSPRRGGGHDLVKVLDFGVAKVSDPGLDELTKKGDVFGTPPYMSPEQAMAKPVVPASDVYTSGVIAYEMCCGRPPFVNDAWPQVVFGHAHHEPPALRELRPEGERPLPEELEQLIADCLAKSPDERPKDGEALNERLDALQERSRAWTGSRDALPAAGGPNDREVIARWSSILDEEGTNIMSTLRTDTGGHPVASGGPRMWHWEDMVRKARNLAEAMSSQDLASEEILGSLAALQAAENAVVSVETELALLRNRIEEAEHETREAQARVRHAVVDLSMDRAEQAEGGAADPSALADLDGQIATLDQKFDDLGAELEQRVVAIEKEVAPLEASLIPKHENQASLEAQLVFRLRKARADSPDIPRLQEMFDELEEDLVHLTGTGE